MTSPTAWPTAPAPATLDTLTDALAERGVTVTRQDTTLVAGPWKITCSMTGKIKAEITSGCRVLQVVLGGMSNGADAIADKFLATRKEHTPHLA